MKLAYLAHTQIPSNVASSIHVMRMCHAFSNVGHDVTLLCPTAEDRNTKEDPFEFYGVRANFKIQRLPSTNSFVHRSMGTHRWVRWTTRMQPFDAIYARCQGLHTFKLHKLRKPFIIECHLLHQTPKFAQLLENPNLQAIVTISKQLANDYQKHYGLAKQRILLARDGADDLKPCVPRELPGRNGTRCGYVGNLYPGKGVELILPLARRCPHVDFHVFGGQPDEVEYWQKATGTTDPQNLFFHGAIPPHATDAARIACDILLAPYQPVVQGRGGDVDIARWMSPLKLFEYMAAGRTVVASDLPVLREFLNDGKNALLCPPTDVDAWETRINWAATHRRQASEIAQRAKQEFQTKYSWQSRAQRISQQLKWPPTTKRRTAA